MLLHLLQNILYIINEASIIRHFPTFFWPFIDMESHKNATGRRKPSNINLYNTNKKKEMASCDQDLKDAVNHHHQQVGESHKNTYRVHPEQTVKTSCKNKMQLKQT